LRRDNREIVVAISSLVKLFKIIPEDLRCSEVSGRNVS
jgi:hypothetical protein